eukprot:SAG22_NODE_1500_length_4283_cov_5.412285_1_plen_539_part_00
MADNGAGGAAAGLAPESAAGSSGSSSANGAGAGTVSTAAAAKAAAADAAEAELAGQDDEDYGDDGGDDEALDREDGEDDGGGDSSDMEFGSSDDEGSLEEEDDAPKERFVIHGKTLTEEQQKRAMRRSGFVPASEGLDPANWKAPHMRPSKFAGRAPTCVFGLAAEGPLPPGVVPCPDAVAHVTFRIERSNIATVGSAFKSGGFKRLLKGSEWTCYWGRVRSYKVLDHYQKVNHFPGTFQLGRKDCCARNIARLRRRCGAALAPPFARVYHLPADRAELEADMDPPKAGGGRVSAKSAEPKSGRSLFIVKPNASSRGRGIRLISHKHEIPKGKMLVQRYISNPYLVDGYKSDIRVYVVATSFDPLRLYIHDDGLVRFATEKYNTPNTKGTGQKIAHHKSKMAHITNYSIQKNQSKFVENTDVNAPSTGSKWSLKAFRAYLREVQGVDDNKVWASIKDTCVRTILSAEAKVYTQTKMVRNGPVLFCCTRASPGLPLPAALPCIAHLENILHPVLVGARSTARTATATRSGAWTSCWTTS